MNTSMNGANDGYDVNDDENLLLTLRVSEERRSSARVRQSRNSVRNCWWQKVHGCPGTSNPGALCVLSSNKNCAYRSLSHRYYGQQRTNTHMNAIITRRNCVMTGLPCLPLPERLHFFFKFHRIVQKSTLNRSTMVLTANLRGKVHLNSFRRYVIIYRYTMNSSWTEIDYNKANSCTK